MKIRTITIGVGNLDEPTLRAAGAKLRRAVQAMESRGYVVQSGRISLPAWDDYLADLTPDQRGQRLQRADQACIENKIDYCSVGVVRTPGHVQELAHAIANSETLCGSIRVASQDNGVDYQNVTEAARAICQLACNTQHGLGNFRMAAACCVQPDVPFFPVAYQHADKVTMSIGCENSDLLVEALEGAGTVDAGVTRFADLMRRHYGKLERYGEQVAAEVGLPFSGLDTSIAPAVQPEHSVARAFSAVGIEFGSPGTLALCSRLTAVTKDVPVRRIGYCGLMLPVMEDSGLASLAHNAFSIPDILTYSSVCGVGVDVVPVPGEVAQSRIRGLLVDVAAMSLKLEKPLCVRILPVPGKRAGERTEFDHPYICNCQVMAL